MKSFIENALNRQNDSKEETSRQLATPEVSEPQPTVVPQTPVDNFSSPAPQQQAVQQDTFEDVKDAKILVIGAGGMGNNAINRLHMMGVSGADTVAINTDKQHLLSIQADSKILIGKDVTKGLGAGGYPSKGKEAAQESTNEIRSALQDVDLIFLVSGMGGGTGTGCAPVISEEAKKSGAIVIGVVTMPFKIEGGRISKAEEGLAKLRQVCDTVIVIENDKLLEIAGDMPLQQAFAVADEIIVTMIKGITETIATPSIVNLDYADVKAVMSNGGVAVIGVGESSTAARAREAVEEAMSNPLLDVDYKGATGALIHITGGQDMKLQEIGEVGDFVAKHLDAEASTIWGARIDDELNGKIRVITIITGVQSQYVLGPQELNSSENEKNLGSTLGIKMM
ncbi:MAG: cell division protein FtsZ [Candidatus Aenigmarchaeota archaeon]|nr:cell division protein FtsZ [Candidatus Aenigmarchaeota archaeon]